ncbi:MAG: fibronectin type III domain-containing protein [Acutalibacteraceae bacterium]
MKKSLRKIFTFFLAVTILSSSLVFTFPAQAKSEGLSLMRQTVIEEMKNMSMVKWKAGKTYTTYHVYYYNGGGGEKMTWQGGKTYYGVPYSQNPNIINPINHKNNVDYNVFMNSLSKDGTVSRDLGRNDCSSSVVMSIQKVDKKMQLSFTRLMKPGVNNIVAVGNYTYYGDKLTTCQKNGSAVMYACYSKLKPGDMLIQDGHAMMVIGVDPSKKTVKVIHHTSYNKHYYPETDTTVWASNSAPTNTNWGVNDTLSYYYCWVNGYVPLASKTIIEDDAKKHDVTMCSKVTGLQQTGSTSSSVTLSWDKDKKATGYIIYQLKDGEFVKIGSTKKTSFTIDSLNSARDYRFAVKSYLKYDKKTYTVIDFSFINATTSPKRVSGVSVSLNKKGTVAKVTWNETKNAQKYYVYRAVKKDGKYYYLGSTAERKFVDENLSKDKTYYYQVRAVIYRSPVKYVGKPSRTVKAVKK